MADIFWIMGGSIVLGAAFVITYLSGSRYGFKQGEQVNESIERNMKATNKYYESLEAMACVSSGKCRRTPSEYTNELLMRMAMKELWRQVEEEGLELAPDLIEKMMEQKEQDDAEAREEVEEYCIGCLANNGNCGHQANDTVGTCPRVDRLKRERIASYLPQNEGLTDSIKEYSPNFTPAQIMDLTPYYHLLKGDGGGGYARSLITAKYGDRLSALGVEDRLISCILWEYKDGILYGVLMGNVEFVIRGESVEKYSNTQAVTDANKEAAEKINARTKSALKQSIKLE
jgi:hypothetical protein